MSQKVYLVKYKHQRSTEHRDSADGGKSLCLLCVFFPPLIWSVRRTGRMHQCPILGKKHAQPPHFSRNIKLYLELAGILALCAIL